MEFDVTQRLSIWNSMLGATVSYHDVAGVRTRCVRAGDSGDHVVLLHGTSGHLEAFAHNMTPLSENFQVLAIDMLGHGLTDKPAVEYVIPDYTAHIRSLMDELGIERAHFVGESLGGWVAQYLGGEMPERVLRVVNCTGGVFRWPEGQTAEEAAEREFMVGRSQALSEMTRDNVAKRLEMLFHDPADATDELIDTRFHMYTRPGMAEVLPKLHHMLPYDSEDRAKYSLTPARLEGIEVPVLYLWGEFNPGCSVDTVERAVAITPGSSLYVTPGAGHWPQWEKPADFNREVMTFLTG
jgi:pimeloyl-ACP methyl ester carboxylesterase